MKKQIQIFDTYTDVFRWIRGSDKRHNVLQGGTNGSKTYSVVQLAAHICIEEVLLEPFTIISETYGTLDRGALRDFKKLIKSSDILKSALVKPDRVTSPFVFKNGNILQFVALDKPGKAKVGKHDYLFVNEANEVRYDVVEKMIERTSKQIFYDFNPDTTFWVHSEILTKKSSAWFISNFTHNPFCPENIKTDLLEVKRRWIKSGDSVLYNRWQNSGNEKLLNKYRQTKDWKDYQMWYQTLSVEIYNEWVETTDPILRNHWYVYGLGKSGVTQGVIYPNVVYVNSLPLNLEKAGYFIDWGFADDPLAMGRAGYNNRGLFSKELIYETGLTTSNLIKKLGAFGIRPTDIIVCDNANPSDINQVCDAGFSAVPCKKGSGSVKQGIKNLQAKTIHLTSDSLNFKKEAENYKYKKDKGVWTNTPNDKHNHLFDGLRYYDRYAFPFEGDIDTQVTTRRLTMLEYARQRQEYL